MGETGNRYLQENFAPVRQEVTLTQLPVAGSIPEFLDGRYVRNGPNPVLEPNPSTYHWFLGTGMVHGIRIRQGNVEWYRNRWVRSSDVAKALGEPIHPGPVHARFDFSANTHVIGHAGRTFATVEAGGRPYELTEELETVGPCDFDGTLPGGYTAHTKRDPSTGELHGVSYFFGWGNRVQYSVLGTDARIKRTVDVEVSGSPMMHDFSLTEKHVVFYDLPVTFDAAMASTSVPDALSAPARSVFSHVVGRRRIPKKVTATMMRLGGNSVFPYSWNPDYPARVGVMDRLGDGRDVKWMDIEPCYVFHPVNAYENGEQIVADVVRHEKMFATDQSGPNEGAPTLERWRIDLAAGKVFEERIDDRGQEFPRHDERLTGRCYRYGYTVGLDTTTDGNLDASGTLYKHDFLTERIDMRDFGSDCSVGEFVFVPAGGDAREDEGVLMGFVYDSCAHRSDLVLLDAETLEIVAEVLLPIRVPHGLHGSWIPAEAS
ncbi:MAG TPA: carotenoid oxygenase family protein [Acidimicrobiales bacterium]|nr:carotenoid oxygenase family protein [Acidimicrobiales bacterium]